MVIAAATLNKMRTEPGPIRGITVKLFCDHDQVLGGVEGRQGRKLIELCFLGERGREELGIMLRSHLKSFAGKEEEGLR